MPGRGGRQRPVPGRALTMRVRHEPGHVLVTVAGEIDIATVAQLEEQLSALAVAGDAVLADLTQVHAICGRDHILRLFHLTGLDHRIAAARTLTEALQSDQRS